MSKYISKLQGNDGRGFADFLLKKPKFFLQYFKNEINEIKQKIKLNDILNISLVLFETNRKNLIYLSNNKSKVIVLRPVKK